jgi:hypothetical protein
VFEVLGQFNQSQLGGQLQRTVKTNLSSSNDKFGFVLIKRNTQIYRPILYTNLPYHSKCSFLFYIKIIDPDFKVRFSIIENFGQFFVARHYFFDFFFKQFFF